MRVKIICGALAVAVLLTALTGCSGETQEITTATSGLMEQITGDIQEFRPVDCGVQAQAVYDYPFLGMTIKLPQTLLDKMDSRDVFVVTREDYTAEGAISYAFLRFSAPSQAQKEESGMSVDIFAWEEALEKLGALGIYRKDMAAQMDALTACDTHKKLGESADGTYEYYLSLNSHAETGELEALEITFSAMHELDLSLGYTAFSADRLDGVANVGEFTTQDVFGTEYTQSVFQEYELTLVNVFATWCSPCVEEMPELERLRQEFEARGIKLGVVAMVLDAKTVTGALDVERAQALYERSGAGFPFLVPDDGNMNGRLTGIESIPESFFVDGNGNIVSEPYIGARSLAEWTQIVEDELAKLRSED